MSCGRTAVARDYEPSLALHVSGCSCHELASMDDVPQRVRFVHREPWPSARPFVRRVFSIVQLCVTSPPPVFPWRLLSSGMKTGRLPPSSPSFFSLATFARLCDRRLYWS